MDYTSWLCKGSRSKVAFLKKESLWVISVGDENPPVLDLYPFVWESNNSLDKRFRLLRCAKNDYVPSGKLPPSQSIGGDFGEEVFSVVVVGEHRVSYYLVRPCEGKIEGKEDDDGDKGGLDNLVDEL